MPQGPSLRQCLEAADPLVCLLLSPFSPSLSLRLLPRVPPPTKSLPKKLARFSPASSSTLMEPSQLTSLASCWPTCNLGGNSACFWPRTTTTSHRELSIEAS